MIRIIRLSLIVCCLFALIALPVACSGDKEEKVPAKKAETKHAPRAEAEEVEHAAEVEVAVAVAHATEAKHAPKTEAAHAAEAKVEHAPKTKPVPDKVLSMLKDGNKRFIEGISNHPHINRGRLIQAGKENQGDHAYATVITCSDSRVPVELIFDAGVMDIFVIRVAGNVCDVDEIGSIEYGLSHVHTPVLVVLGHTQCGAVTAVTHAVHGTGHALERNIPPLVDNIEPAVHRAIAKHPELHGDDVIPHAIEENIWQGIEDLFMNSPATRDIVKSGAAKVVGAIYDVGTGKIEWLPDTKVDHIFKTVEANPARAIKVIASGGH